MATPENLKTTRAFRTEMDALRLFLNETKEPQPLVKGKDLIDLDEHLYDLEHNLASCNMPAVMRSLISGEWKELSRIANVKGNTAFSRALDNLENEIITVVLVVIKDCYCGGKSSVVPNILEGVPAVPSETLPLLLPSVSTAVPSEMPLLPPSVSTAATAVPVQAMVNSMPWWRYAQSMKALR